MAAKNPMTLSDAGIAHLAKLTGLKTLALDKTAVTDNGLAVVKHFPALEELSLLQCQVLTDAGLAHIGRLTRLEWLELANTPVTDAGINELQKSLPNCHISR